MIALPTPHLLFLGDVTNPLDAKTAMGLRDWRPEDCVGQYRLPGCAVDLGLPDMDFTAAAAAGAKSVVIGVAPSVARSKRSGYRRSVRHCMPGLPLSADFIESSARNPRLQRRPRQQGSRLSICECPRHRFRLPAAGGERVSDS